MKLICLVYFYVTLSITTLSQSWIVLLSACADNGDVDLAAAIHRFLLSRNGPLSRQVKSGVVFYCSRQASICLLSLQILSTVVLMLMHYKTPFDAILLAQQSQQCNCYLVPPLSVLSRLKKALDDIAYEDRMMKLKQELHSPVKVLLY